MKNFSKILVTFNFLFFIFFNLLSRDEGKVYYNAIKDALGNSNIYPSMIDIKQKINVNQINKFMQILESIIKTKKDEERVTALTNEILKFNEIISKAFNEDLNPVSLQEALEIQGIFKGLPSKETQGEERYSFTSLPSQLLDSSQAKQFDKIVNEIKKDALKSDFAEKIKTEYANLKEQYLDAFYQKIADRPFNISQIIKKFNEYSGVSKEKLLEIFHKLAWLFDIEDKKIAQFLNIESKLKVEQEIKAPKMKPINSQEIEKLLGGYLNKLNIPKTDEMPENIRNFVNDANKVLATSYGILALREVASELVKLLDSVSPKIKPTDFTKEKFNNVLREIGFDQYQLLKFFEAVDTISAREAFSKTIIELAKDPNLDENILEEFREPFLNSIAKGKGTINVLKEIAEKSRWSVNKVINTFGRNFWWSSKTIDDLKKNYKATKQQQIKPTSPKDKAQEKPAIVKQPSF